MVGSPARERGPLLGGERALNESRMGSLFSLRWLLLTLRRSREGEALRLPAASSAFPDIISALAVSHKTSTLTLLSRPSNSQANPPARPQAVLLPHGFPQILTPDVNNQHLITLPAPVPLFPSLQAAPSPRIFSRCVKIGTRDRLIWQAWGPP